MQWFFLFAPGAGAPSSHEWMRHWHGLLEQLAPVFSCDYDYQRERRRRPDPLPKLIAAHRSALAEARRDSKGEAVLIGKSMGSRIGCHVSLEDRVAGLICLGYPLCGGGDPQKLRDKVLRDISTPILFVQGTRDALCPLPLLAQVRQAMTTRNELHLVEGGDHSLLARKSELLARGETQEHVDARILESIGKFVRSLADQPRVTSTVASSI